MKAVSRDLGKADNVSEGSPLIHILFHLRIGRGSEFTESFGQGE